MRATFQRDGVGVRDGPFGPRPPAAPPIEKHKMEGAAHLANPEQGRRMGATPALGGERASVGGGPAQRRGGHLERTLQGASPTRPRPTPPDQGESSSLAGDDTIPYIQEWVGGRNFWAAAARRCWQAEWLGQMAAVTGVCTKYIDVVKRAKERVCNRLLATSVLTSRTA